MFSQKFKKRFLFFLGLFFFFNIASTGAADLPAEVRLAYAGAPRVWILGKIDGSFEKNLGVPVKWIAFNSGADVLSLFAAKEIDIARFGSSPVAAGVARKLPIKVIAVPEIIATSERLIARQGIASLKELEGKTVAYPANSTAQYAFEAAIQFEKGIDRSKIKTVTLTPPEIVAAWQRGDIDAAYVWGPFSQQIEQRNGKEIYATRDLRKHGVLIFNNLAVRKEFAEQYPEIVVKFLKTFDEKVAEYKKDPEGSAQRIAKHLDIPVETARAALAGVEHPSLAEQLSPAFLGNANGQAESNIAKAYKDAAIFLSQIGELRSSDIPSSYEPAIDIQYLKRAANQ